jgi:hypothetical protein
MLRAISSIIRSGGLYYNMCCAPSFVVLLCGYPGRLLRGPCVCCGGHCSSSNKGLPSWWWAKSAETCGAKRTPIDTLLYLVGFSLIIGIIYKMHGKINLKFPSSWLTSSVRMGQYLNICIQPTSNTAIRQAGIVLHLNCNYITDYIWGDVVKSNHINDIWNKNSLCSHSEISHVFSGTMSENESGSSTAHNNRFTNLEASSLIWFSSLVRPNEALFVFRNTRSVVDKVILRSIGPNCFCENVLFIFQQNHEAFIICIFTQYY